MVLAGVMLVVTLVGTAAQTPAPADASAIAFAAASQVAELDMGKLKGEPTRLAWSPDGSQFYLQTSEIKAASRTDRHYVISSTGRTQSVEAMPDWAGKYWTWKAHHTSPASATFKIEVVGPETRTVRATAAPMGGDLARGGTGGTEGTTLSDATGAAAQSQTVSVITLRLRGEVVGEFINGPLVPGATFGWAPGALSLIASTGKDGKVFVMDEKGRRKELPGASNAALPAWSDDGAKLAYLKKDGRRSYRLVVAGVSR